MDADGSTSQSRLGSWFLRLSYQKSKVIWTRMVTIPLVFTLGSLIWLLTGQVAMVLVAILATWFASSNVHDLVRLMHWESRGPLEP